MLIQGYEGAKFLRGNLKEATYVQKNWYFTVV